MNKEHDLVILIAWHTETSADRVTVFNANMVSFREYNPDIHIEVIINPFPDKREAWLSTDLSIFSWYRDNVNVVSARYLIVEWDCWCNCDLRDYYKKVWECDLVVPNVKYPEIDDWYWFSQVDHLPVHLRPFATGITPFCGVLVSDKAMRSICDVIFDAGFNGLNSELRFATIATMLNIHPIVNPVFNRTLGWRAPFPGSEQHVGLHHPRKEL